MSDEYERPDTDPAADLCAYTSYDSTKASGASVGGDAVTDGDEAGTAGDESGAAGDAPGAAGDASGDAAADDGASSADPDDYEEVDSVGREVPATGAGAEGLERRVWQALYDVRDPEMPVSIVDLGLIYAVDVDEEAGRARVDMTLTYTGCPARDMLLGEVEQSVANVDGVDEVDLRLVWSPGWTVEMVTPQGRDALREFGLSV